MAKKLTKKGAFFASMLLLFGCGSTLTLKGFFQTTVLIRNSDGYLRLKEFNKPLLTTLEMFIGMALLLIPFSMERCKAKKLEQESSTDLSLDSTDSTPAKKSSTLFLLIPTVFDLIASALSSFGLVLITPSLYQILGGTIIVFTALLSRIFLGSKIHKYQWMSLIIMLSGIYVVAISAKLDAHGEREAKNVLLGSALVVISQCIWAAQFVAEEMAMGDLDASPSKVVGFEGLYGAILMIGVMYVAQNYVKGNDTGGSLENSTESITMLQNSFRGSAFLLSNLFIIAFYNFFGQSTTQELSASHRTIFEAMRALFVWIAGLGLNYLVPNLGEHWTEYSWLRAIGFALMCVATFLYNRIWEYPGIFYPPHDSSDSETSSTELSEEEKPLIEDSDDI